MNIKFLLVLAAPLFVASIFSSCKDKDDDDKTSYLNSYQETKEFGEKFLMEKRAEEGVIETASGLMFKVNTMGTGIRPEDGDTIYAVVTGNKVEGKQNEFRYDTLNYVSMYGQVAALREGIKYMPVGSDFDFWAPYYLAYGSSSYSGMSRSPRTSVTVNPYSAVKFNVKLLGVRKEDK